MPIQVGAKSGPVIGTKCPKCASFATLQTERYKREIVSQKCTAKKCGWSWDREEKEKA